ncbi:hypothetical protein LED50_27060, partial [Salmonella enterica]|nr:hypothetical protein [Salmonella enterica]
RNVRRCKDISGRATLNTGNAGHRNDNPATPGAVTLPIQSVPGFLTLQLYTPALTTQNST